MTERPQFVRLFDNPKVYRARTFQAFWKQNDKAHARLGITIKGRLSSIWRTRIKRIIREWFRSRQESLPSIDLNIVIKVPAELNLVFVDSLKRDLVQWKG
jgi:ribonuclease P protein component